MKTVKALGGVILAVCFTLSAMAETDSSLICYYHFDEGKGDIARDSSPNGFDGKVVNGYWEKGKVGLALEFNGVDTDVYVTPIPEILNEAKEITVMAWIKTESPKQQMIITKQLSGRGFTGWTLWIGCYNTHKGKLFFHCRDSDINSDCIVDNGKWHFVAVTAKCGGEGKVFVDGELKKSGPIKDDTWENDLPAFHIGSYYGQKCFEGMMDEVRIYKRVLSDAEVKSVYEKDCAASDKKMEKR